MEPLTSSIRTKPIISGIDIGGHTHKISLYTNDVIISLTKPEQSLQHIHRTLDLFSKASHYKINYSKSSMLGVDLWASNSILLYLGIQLIAPTSRLLPLNFSNLVSKLQNAIKKPPACPRLSNWLHLSL